MLRGRMYGSIACCNRSTTYGHFNVGLFLNQAKTKTILVDLFLYV